MHARIYEVIKRNIDRGLLADPVVLKAHFACEGTLEELGGEAYLRELAASVPNLAHVGDYGARDLRDAISAAALSHLGNEISSQRASDEDVDNTPRDQIEDRRTKALFARRRQPLGGGFVNFNERGCRSAQGRREPLTSATGNVSGVSTGLIDLDKRLGGLQKSDLIIIAARPGMGKSALALNIAFNAARNMPTTPSASSGAKPQTAPSPPSSASKCRAPSSRSASCPQNPVFPRTMSAAATSDRTIMTNRRHARAVAGCAALHRRDRRAFDCGAGGAGAAAQAPLKASGLLVIDYVQLMTASGRKKTDNRVQEVTEITTGLKALGEGTRYSDHRLRAAFAPSREPR